MAKQGRLNRKKRKERKWVCEEQAFRANLRLRPGQALRDAGALNSPALPSVLADRRTRGKSVRPALVGPLTGVLDDRGLAVRGKPMQPVTRSLREGVVEDVGAVEANAKHLAAGPLPPSLVRFAAQALKGRGRIFFSPSLASLQLPAHGRD